MPKSKRNKVVSLTQAKKKGREHKEALVATLRDCVDQYAYLYVFAIQNMRTAKVKEVRAKWQNSRFFMGKNKVTKVALGKGEEDEYKDNLHLLGDKVSGNCGLMFTDAPRDEVIKFFASYREADYARAGFKATRTIVLPPGPLQFPHSMEPQLRQLGLSTSLKEGVIYLEKEFTACLIGDPITPEQAKVLKLLDVKMSEFSMTPIAVWSASDSKFEELHHE